MFSQEDFTCKDGFYGASQNFGGQYVPEVLLPALEELEAVFLDSKQDPEFLQELKFYQKNLVGRPSPLVFASNLSRQLGGAKIYLKNEGNNFTGSHKINHCLYHALLAKRLGKKRVIAETGAGQHGLAVATVCAKFGLQAKIFMGQKNLEKQYPNVFWMKQLGAEVIPVTSGNQKLTDAADAAIGEWINDPEAYFMLGSVVGPHPFPEIVRESQKIVGQEIKQQLRELENDASVLPTKIIACIGGGSNAIGAFDEFLTEESVELIGVEAGGTGDQPGQHASRIASGQGKVSIFEGFKSFFLLKSNGQMEDVGGIAAGLDYNGIGPIHAYLYSIGRLKITKILDTEAVSGFQLLAQTEGILAALESAHAVAEAIKQAPGMSPNEIIVVNLSGRADNYIFNIASATQDQEFQDFCNRWQGC